MVTSINLDVVVHFNHSLVGENNTRRIAQQYNEKNKSTSDRHAKNVLRTRNCETKSLINQEYTMKESTWLAIILFPKVTTATICQHRSFFFYKLPVKKKTFSTRVQKKPEKLPYKSLSRWFFFRYNVIILT